MPQTQVPSPALRTFLPESRARRVAVALWRIVRRFLFRCTPPLFNPFRLMLLRIFGAEVHRSSFIHPTVRVDRPWNLKLGSNAVIHHKVVLDCMGSIEIGESARISQFCHLCAATHDYRRRDMRVVTRLIHIGSDVWLASDVFVGPGVRIGDRTVVGARANVFSDLPAEVVAVGSPARPVKYRDGTPFSGATE